MPKEWQPKPPVDWSKETCCTECRLPIKDFGVSGILSYKPTTCRACKYIRVRRCTDCFEEIGFCTRSNRPPYKGLDVKKKCVWYHEN